MTPGPAWLILPTYDEAENVERIVRAVAARARAQPLRRAPRSSSSTTTRRTGRARSPTGSPPRSPRSRCCTATAPTGPRARRTSPASRTRSSTAPGLVLEMDADFSHDPNDVERLIAAVADGADLALGSRYVDGGGVSDWGLVRRFVSRGGCLYAQAVLGLPVRDLTGGFKCFRREVLEAIDLPTVRSKGYAFQVELTYRALHAGFRVVEVPITFRDRELGPVEDELADRARGGGPAAAAAPPRGRPFVQPPPPSRRAADLPRCEPPRARRRPGLGGHPRDARGVEPQPLRDPAALGRAQHRASPSRCCSRVCIVALRRRTPDPTPLVLPGVYAPATFGDVLHRLRAQPARPRAARDGVRRRLHREVVAAARGRGLQRARGAGSTTAPGRPRSRSSACATLFSLAHAVLRARRRASRRSPPQIRHDAGELLLALTPHAVPELVALFLPLAAWLVAARAEAWDQLLAATSRRPRSRCPCCSPRRSSRSASPRGSSVRFTSYSGGHGRPHQRL